MGIDMPNTSWWISYTYETWKSIKATLSNSNIYTIMNFNKQQHNKAYLPINNAVDNAHMYMLSMIVLIAG